MSSMQLQLFCRFQATEPRCGTCVLPPPNESYDLLFRQSAKTDVVRVPPSIIIRISPIPLRYLVNDHVQRRSVERTVIY